MSVSFRFLTLLAGLFALEFAGVAFYLSLENDIPFWDYAMYARMAQNWFSSGFSWASFQDSFRGNYNLLFAVPSLLTFSLFGASRTVFILTNFVFYAFPAQLVLGLIVRKVLDIPGTRGLFYGALLGAAVSPFWVPLLQGYPDHAAAFCFFLAFLLAMDGPAGWKRGLKIGFLLALAVVFRRPFVYVGLALGFVLAFLSAKKLWPFSWRKAGSFFVFFLFLGLSGFTTLLLIEPSYLKTMLSVNFTALYDAYRHTPSEYLLYLLSRLGVAYIFFPLLGACFFVIARDEKLLKQTPPGQILRARAPLYSYEIIPLFFLTWLYFWCLGPAQFGDHYLVAVLPLVCATGLAGLRYIDFSPKDRRRLLFLSPALVLVFLSLFWPQENHPLPSDPPDVGLLPVSRPPWKRKDLSALRALAEDVAKTTTPQDRVMLAGSSFVLNQDLLRAVYTDLLGDSVTPQRFIPIPEADGPDATRARDVFASANIYLLPTPPQFHLQEEKQRVVTALRSAASDLAFKKELASFFLDRGVSVQIVRRPPWTGQTLHNALALFQDASPWVLARGAPWGTLKGRTNDTFSFEGLLSAQEPELVLFYNKPLDVGTYRLGASFVLGRTCSGWTPRLSVEDSSGISLFEKTGSLPQNPGVYFWSFAVSQPQAPGFLFLSFFSADTRACPFSVSSLVFERSPL